MKHDAAIQNLRRLFLDRYDRCTNYERDKHKLAYSFRCDMGAIRVALEEMGEPQYDIPSLPPRPADLIPHEKERTDAPI